METIWSLKRDAEPDREKTHTHTHTHSHTHTHTPHTHTHTHPTHTHTHTSHTHTHTHSSNTVYQILDKPYLQGVLFLKGACGLKSPLRVESYLTM